MLATGHVLTSICVKIHLLDSLSKTQLCYCVLTSIKWRRKLSMLCDLQAQSMNVDLEKLQVKQCGMLLAYSSSRHPAVTPGQTRQALLQVLPQRNVM